MGMPVETLLHPLGKSILHTLWGVAATSKSLECILKVVIVLYHERIKCFFTDEWLVPLEHALTIPRPAGVPRF